MPHYTVRSSSNQKVFLICGYGLMGLMLLLLLIALTNWMELDDRWSHAIAWTVASLLVLGLIGVFVLIFRDSMNKFRQKVSFDVVENKVVRRIEGQVPIELPLDQISTVGESSSGLIVRGREPMKGFVIPRAVVGFEQLRQQLSDHSAIVPIKTKNSLFLARVFALILIIALYVLLLTAKTRLVLVTAAVVLLFQSGLIFGMRKTWARPRSPKLVVAFILSWLVVLWFVYERFSSIR